ncbi:hypothetical protein BKA70DRAFT_1315456 [Coprinopsis sp. MPI-PUGE-AT-0042]|nr:hypothetical protein BKA70DRAFT_1315456 [Coprinopsis sp. MPI-PUGE-AT-0042]
MSSKVQNSAVHRGSLTPAIPLELIYKIVDDHWQLLAQDNGRQGLRAVAYTCQSLASYCRPYLYRSVTLYDLKAPLPPVTWSGVITKPDRFSALVQQYPSISHLTKELRIVLIIPEPSKSTLNSEKPKISLPLAETETWTRILTASYSRLTTLRFTVSWKRVSPPFVDSFLSAIKAAPCLESLELEGTFLPLKDVLLNIPGSLKHFSMLGKHFLHGSGDDWGTPPAYATLDSLTLPGSLFSRWLSDVFLSESPPFNLSALRHLQMEPFGPTEPTSRLIHTVSSTLRCIHLSFDRLFMSWRFRPPHFRLLDFPVLTHVEVSFQNDPRHLTSTLGWLDESAQIAGGKESQKAAGRLSSITVCILIKSEARLEPSDVYGSQMAGWEPIASGTAPVWPSLQFVNVVGFGVVIHRPNDESFPGHFVQVDTPWPLSPFRGQPNSDSYGSLWKECSCSGWRES